MAKQRGKSSEQSCSLVDSNCEVRRVPAPALSTSSCLRLRCGLRPIKPLTIRQLSCNERLFKAHSGSQLSRSQRSNSPRTNELSSTFLCVAALGSDRRLHETKPLLCTFAPELCSQPPHSRRTRI